MNRLLPLLSLTLLHISTSLSTPILFNPLITPSLLHLSHLTNSSSLLHLPPPALTWPQINTPITSTYYKPRLDHRFETKKYYYEISTYGPVPITDHAQRIKIVTSLRNISLHIVQGAREIGPEPQTWKDGEVVLHVVYLTEGDEPDVDKELLAHLTWELLRYCHDATVGAREVLNGEFGTVGEEGGLKRLASWQLLFEREE